jgi:hypothetical protein
MSLEPRLACDPCDPQQAFVGDEQGAWHGPASRHWAAMICMVATYRMASIYSIACSNNLQYSLVADNAYFNGIVD